MSAPGFLSDDEIILAEFIEESEASMAVLDRLFLQIEKSPSDVDAINAIFRPIHSIKGNSAFLGLLKTKQLAHHSESLLDAMRTRKLAPTAELINVLLAAVDELKAIMARLRVKKAEVEDVTHFDGLVKRVTMALEGKTVEAILPGAGPVAGSGVTQVVSVADANRMVRVSESVLDELNSIADEIAGINAEIGRYMGDARQPAVVSANGQGDQLGEINSRFTGLVVRLKNDLMGLRKVAIGTLLQKAPRIIRDVCASTGKQASLTITGDCISVSRSVVQALDAPLLHLLRNAVDHGCETPDERVKLGKKPECEIRIEVIQLPDAIVLKLTDDGRGIDYKALQIKAIRNGTLACDKVMTPAEVLSLIFVSGLSTASKVTDVSGRGVGMDVVKRSIEEVGGQIEVSSVAGKGTQFMIILPNFA